MKLSIFLVLVSFQLAQAQVSPTPENKGKDKVEQIQKNGGSIKIDKTPVLLKDPALSKEGQLPTEIEKPSPYVPPTAEKNQVEPIESSAPHYFGLHASIGFPHPINYGLNYVHSSGFFSAEISTGNFSITMSDVKLKIDNTEIGARWHPFAGSFYLGALVGSQKITGSKTERVSGFDAEATVDIKSSYITPHLGWMWGVADGGFFMSMDFGFQTNSGVTSDLTSNAPPAVQAQQDYIDLAKDVKDNGEKIGKQSLPAITLLKIGWLF